jgi:tRNA(Ile)-lysidine synthase
LAAVKSAVDDALSDKPRPRATRGRARVDAPLVVAYSGGRDSIALLSLVCTLRDARTPGFGRPHAVHVHHGLHRDADSWVDHCERQCAGLKVELSVRRVRLDRRGLGVEAAAREARYRALAEVARELGAAAVLTAHHLDDRLETFLLQWIRGAGPEGLSAMAQKRELGSPHSRASGRGDGDEGSPLFNTGVRKIVGESPLSNVNVRSVGAQSPFSRGSGREDGGEGDPSPPILLLRPLLHVPRERIERYVEQKALGFVEDPSNSDPRFDRNALRQRVMPELGKLRSGFRGAAERSIELIAESAEVLRSVAQEDLQSCTRDAPASMLRIDRLGMLPEARRTLVLREWLAQAHLPVPPRARLREALRQAVHAGADARLLIRVGDHELRRHRGLLCLNPPRPGAPALHALQWQGESELAVPSWGGALVFSRTNDEGFDARWLGAEPLQLRPRTGGERFKPHPTRPSKRLKQIFQEARIPEYQRSALPLVWRDGRLIYVAGIGPDARLLVAEGERVRIDWVGAAPLLRD